MTKSAFSSDGRLPATREPASSAASSSRVSVPPYSNLRDSGIRVRGYGASPLRALRCFLAPASSGLLSAASFISHFHAGLEPPSPTKPRARTVVFPCARPILRTTATQTLAVTSPCQPAPRGCLRICPRRTPAARETLRQH